ncbi:MAG: GNAT family N-acetyltransferase [Clostridia bacterium]|nr:GNAT family N-acetyltransferase [Clostridia bacterium]
MIRRAEAKDACRMAEIEIFNYRLHFYPIFQNDDFYFDELQVTTMMQQYDRSTLAHTWVWDDGVVKGFVRMEERQIKKLFVEPVLQGQGIGARLLEHAVNHEGACWLWALEKNERAIRFYQRHGFCLTGERMPEEDTEEYLVRMER